MKSISDFSKLINLRNATTNTIIATYEYTDFFETRDITTSLTVYEYLMLRHIRDCIFNNHDCLISVGYKNYD